MKFFDPLFHQTSARWPVTCYVAKSPSEVNSSETKMSH